MTGAFNFSNTLRGYFPSDVMALWDGKAKAILMKGAFPLGHGDIQTAETATVSITVFDDWKRVPPLVRAHDFWVRDGLDWHASGPGGSICYVFDGYWRYQLEKMSVRQDPRQLISYAAGWCANSIAWLLYRHLYAHENRLTDWPSSWGGWPHDRNDAWREFERLKRQGSL